MKTTWIVVPWLLSCSAVLAQAAGTPLARTTNSITLDTSTADACSPTVVEHFSRHSLVSPEDRLDRSYILITQTFDVGQGCFEGFDPAKVSVTAKSVDITTGKVGSKVLWTFTTKGIAGEVDARAGAGIYRVDMPGCCASSPTSKYFSLRTGKLVASSTGPLLSVYGKRPLGNRYVAVEDTLASSPFDHTPAIATIFVGDDEALRETLKVSRTSKAGVEEWWIAELTFKGQETSRKNLSVSDFAEATIQILLRCRCNEEPLKIEIPLSNEGFAEQKARVKGPPNVTLTKAVHNIPTRQSTNGNR